MDTSRSKVNIFNLENGLFNLENESLKRFKSHDTKIQYYFNALYHPKKSNIVSKFINKKSITSKDKKKEKLHIKTEEDYVI